MNGVDYAVLFGVLLGIAGYGMWRTRHRRDLSTYVKGHGTSRWLVIGLSVMATQASAITFLSTPGQGYTDGLGFVQNYFGAPFALILISIVFLPMYRRLGIHTVYEFLGQRFDTKTRLLGAVIFLVQRGLGAGITIYAPAIVLSTVLVAALYILMTVVIVGMIPWEEVRDSRTVASVFIARTFNDPATGRIAGNVMTGLILFVAAASLYATILGYSRVPYAAARDGDFFKAFAHVHPTKRFPDLSLATMAIVSIPFCFFTLGQLVSWLIQVQVLLRGQEVSLAIRAQSIGQGASKVSAHPGVRQALLELQRGQGRDGGVVLEGRDIGTVVFPDAEAKFFLTASPDVRAQRRRDELAARGTPPTLAEVLSEVNERDRRDSTRPVAPLRQAADAVLVDSSALSIEQVVELIVATVKTVERKLAAGS